MKDGIQHLPEIHVGDIGGFSFLSKDFIHSISVTRSCVVVFMPRSRGERSQAWQTQFV